MRTIYTSIALLLLPCLIFAQIPNFSFEDWSSHGGYDNPDHWSSMNSATSATGQFTCEMGTPGFLGNTYLKLTSRTITGLGTVPGIAVCGELNSATHQPVSGFPYSERPVSFKGKWQFMAYGEDQGFISVVLSKWNNNTHQRDTIAYIDQALKGMQMSWASFNLEFNYINYLSSDPPDSALIFCSASNAHNAPTANYSYLWLDSLAFVGTIGKVNNLQNKDFFTLLTDPVSKRVIIKLNHPDAAGFLSINLIDASGRLIDCRASDTSLPSVSFDLSQLSQGLYLIVFLTRNGTYSKSIINRH